MDTVKIYWRMESVYYFVILVSLQMLDTLKRIFSKDIPRLVTWEAFFTSFTSAFFKSFCFLQFSVKTQNFYYMTAVMYIPDEESVL